MWGRDHELLARADARRKDRSRCYMPVLCVARADRSCTDQAGEHNEGALGSFEGRDEVIEAMTHVMAFVLGFIACLLWLIIWLKEDHPRVTDFKGYEGGKR